MEKELNRSSSTELEEGTAGCQKEEYIPRNGVVRAKECLYSKVNISVKQIDHFIMGCCGIIVFFIVIGLMMK